MTSCGAHRLAAGGQGPAQVVHHPVLQLGAEGRGEVGTGGENLADLAVERLLHLGKAADCDRAVGGEHRPLRRLAIALDGLQHGQRLVRERDDVILPVLGPGSRQQPLGEAQIDLGPWHVGDLPQPLPEQDEQPIEVAEGWRQRVRRDPGDRELQQTQDAGPASFREGALHLVGGGSAPRRPSRRTSCTWPATTCEPCWRRPGFAHRSPPAPRRPSPW